jgi:histone H3/H4
MVAKITIKNNIRKIVKELDEENVVNNVAVEVEGALEKKVKEDLKKAIARVKANQRRTLFARDL